MAAKVTIIFHSLYGHVYELAKAIEAGAKSAGAETKILRVQETLPADVLGKMHATESVKAFAHLPVATADDLKAADAIFLGTPTRYGLVTAQMQTFIDSTGGLWGSGALIGKLGSAFTSTSSQHGGQETTLTHLHTFFYHQGMVVSGVPYAAKELLTLDEISGGTPYGATAIAGPTGQRAVTTNEKAIAAFQGKHVASLAAKLAAR